MVARITLMVAPGPRPNGNGRTPWEDCHFLEFGREKGVFFVFATYSVNVYYSYNYNKDMIPLKAWLAPTVCFKEGYVGIWKLGRYGCKFDGHDGAGGHERRRAVSNKAAPS